ncbi:MAG TPA: carbohydrate ABC transporter permease [Kineosporiaceae bacterium]|jgi:multiple sugar transport system permease protein|nr:carbohydrate ABC transporter permease [Kineosporiaceae bacterium]
MSRSRGLPTTIVSAGTTVSVGALRRGLPASAWWLMSSCLAVLFASPLVLSLIGSLRHRSLSQAPLSVPTSVSITNFQGLEGVGVGVRQYAINSIGVALASVVVTVLVATLAGYGFARYAFPGRGVAFLVVILMLMIPFQALITPLYILLRGFGLQDSLVGLTLVYITYQLPFSLFVMRNSFAALPAGLEEAAMIDGCSPWRTFTKVMLPLARPGVITVGLFAFFAAWNEFLAALILLSSQEKYTLPVMLTLVQGGLYGEIDWGVLQAGVMVTMLPCIGIFLVLQRYYVQGLLSGSMK